METRTLGKDLTVTAIGLGCMGFSHGYGKPTDVDEAVKTIRAAYDMVTVSLTLLRFIKARIRMVQLIITKN